MLELLRAWFPNGLVCVRHHGGGAGRAPFGRPGTGRAGEGAVVVPGVGAAGPAAGGPGGPLPARAGGDGRGPPAIRWPSQLVRHPPICPLEPK